MTATNQIFLVMDAGSPKAAFTTRLGYGNLSVVEAQRDEQRGKIPQDATPALAETDEVKNAAASRQRGLKL
jgi:hypothetical protein